MNLLSRHRASFTATLKTLRNAVSPPIVNTHNVVIRGFAAVAAAGNLESEAEMIAASCKEKKSVEPDLVSFNAVIQGLCEEGNVGEAEEVLEEMNRKGLVPDEKFYTSVIHLYCKNMDGGRAYKVLSGMIDIGFSPSVATYNKVIRAYCSFRKVDEAVGVLQDMVERGLSPDASSYSRLISEFCENKELKEALEMKKEMDEKGILPDDETYMWLISGLCGWKPRRLPEAFDLFREMLRGGLLPCDYIYNGLLMNACCLEGEFSKVFHWHDEMVKKGFLFDFVTRFSPSLVTYNALIQGYCFLGRVEEALDILRGMPEMGLSPDAVSYRTVISGFCKIREPVKAFEMKLEADEKSISCLEDTYESLMEDLSDEFVYSSVMNAFCAEGNMEKVYKLEDEVDHNGSLPTSVLFSALLNGLNKKGKTRETKRSLMWISSDRCLSMPTCLTYDTLIENCSNNEFKSVVGLVKGFLMRGLVDEAARAHDTMLHGKYKPDGAVYNLLIFDHCGSLNVHKAYSMYMEMLHYGFAPHIFTVLALIKALYNDGMYNEKSWVIQNTLRSCNLNDSELLEVLKKIKVTNYGIDGVLLDVLAEIAMDGLLLNGGNCSYPPACA